MLGLPAGIGSSAVSMLMRLGDTTVTLAAAFTKVANENKELKKKCQNLEVGAAQAWTLAARVQARAGASGRLQMLVVFGVHAALIGAFDATS